MPRLIHLNGPPGIGKSTLAQMYVDRNPGALNLDADRIVCLIGGWQDRFWETIQVARQIAIGMASTHLGTGHDVVMPQLVTSLSEIEGFEAVARDNYAEFREIVLTASREPSLNRFASRTWKGDRDTLSFIDNVIEQEGGRFFSKRLAVS
jgi:predicted kinase